MRDLDEYEADWQQAVDDEAERKLGLAAERTRRRRRPTTDKDPHDRRP